MGAKAKVMEAKVMGVAVILVVKPAAAVILGGKVAVARAWAWTAAWAAVTLKEVEVVGC